MTSDQVLNSVEQDIHEVFPILSDAFDIDLEDFLEPEDIIVTTTSDPRVVAPNVGEHLMESHFDGENHYLIVYPEKIQEREKLGNESMVGHELSHIVKDAVGRPEYKSLNIDSENYPWIKSVKVSDLLKTRTTEEFIARVGEIKTAAETGSEMDDFEKFEFPGLDAPGYDRGVEVRKRLWDCTLGEVERLIPDGSNLLNMIYHKAGYRAAEDNIMNALGDEELLRQDRADLWGKHGYDLDSYERKVFDEVLVE